MSLPRFLSEFVTVDAERTLLAACSRALTDTPWAGGEFRERIARFGWDYSVDPKRLGPIPEWLQPLTSEVSKVCDTPFDSVTVNEYLAGQRIDPHVDHLRAFGPVIAIVSLGGVCRFTIGAESGPLPARSLLVLAGASRSLPHSVDNVEPWRVSIVFRKRVIP